MGLEGRSFVINWCQQRVSASTCFSFLEPQIAPAEGPDVSERMVIITGPPEAQFKVSAKDHVSLKALEVAGEWEEQGVGPAASCCGSGWCRGSPRAPYIEGSKLLSTEPHS